MRQVITLWHFARPHTIIGSVISISTLYAVVCQHQLGAHLDLLLVALVIGVSCNVYIVGINQIADEAIDRINKPYLPIPSGALSTGQARVIVHVALLLCCVLAAFVSPWLLGIILVSVGIGWAYSMPPFFLKKHHITAAIAITTVRGLMINVGGFLVFNRMVHGVVDLPANVLILTLFIIAFSIAIAWFKDLPDMEGDARYDIRTLAIMCSPKVALVAGHLLVGSAYAITIALNGIALHHEVVPSFATRWLLVAHTLLLALFILNATRIRLADAATVKSFYKRFWWFFFAEYLVYLVAYLVPR